MREHPAFPTTSVSTDCKGLTKREYIAAHVLAGLISKGYYNEQHSSVAAVRLTDALLDRLANTTTETGDKNHDSKEEKSHPEKPDPRQEDLFTTGAIGRG